MDTAFTKSAEEYGISRHGYLDWFVAPDLYGEDLIRQTKRLARFLESAVPTLGHLKALDLISEIVGFDHWHHLRKACASLSTATGTMGAALDPFARSVLLFAGPDPDCRPLPATTRALEALAALLSSKTDLPISTTLDLLARMHGSDTWHILLNRQPWDSPRPLYSFRVHDWDDSPTGAFELSSAGLQMVERQDELFQQFSSRPVEEQLLCHSLVLSMLENRPDFLEGYLAKAEIIRTLSPRKFRSIGGIYSEAISRSEALIPDGFKGQLPWGELGNRFYHRLLYGYMEWCAITRKNAKALALARRQMRRNKADNLGVRFWLPVLLLNEGKQEQAVISVAKLGDPDIDAHIHLLQFLTQYGIGHPSVANTSLLRVLFYMPYFRDIIHNSDQMDYSTRSPQRRMFTPDQEVMFHHFWLVADRLNSHMESHAVKVINDRRVVEAEARLATQYSKIREGAGSVDDWRSAVESTAATLGCVQYE